MGRYYKGIGKQIKTAGVIAGSMLGISLTMVAASNIKVFAATSDTVTETAAVQTASTEAVAVVPYYDAVGYGWRKYGANWKYINEDGSFATNWLLDADKTWYFLGADGVMQTGFIEWKDQGYYLNPNGSMQEGWYKHSDGAVYYFRPGNGDMFVGVQVIAGVTYNFGTDGKAVGLTEIPKTLVKEPDTTVTPEVPTETIPTETTTVPTVTTPPTVTTTTPAVPETTQPETTTTPEVEVPPTVYYDEAGYGWKKNGGFWNYINKNGTKATLWLLDDANIWYFLGEDGNMQTGHIEWKGQQYYLREDGSMLEGFLITQEGIRYYRPGNGDMIIGYYTIDGVLHYFNENGFLATGWQTYNGATYYFNPSTGTPVKGIAVIDGIQYGFNNAGKLDASVIPWNLLLVNSQNSMPANYNVSLSKVAGYQVDSRIATALSQMINAAKKDGVTLRITSAYRTLATQTRLYNNGLTKRLNAGMSYEAAVAERNLYNAEPGKSEHNLGLAIDFISGSTLNDSFAKSSQAKWLVAHAHEYGFILRYEADKVDITKIAYEPWHYRYVGVEAATAIRESGVCLEEYFPNYTTK